MSGTTHYGFAGGTLGTSSVTLYDPANGIIVSMAGTLKNLDASALRPSARRHGTRARGLGDAPHGGPVEVRSVSAAGLTVTDTADGSTLRPAAPR